MANCPLLVKVDGYRGGELPTSVLSGAPVERPALAAVRPTHEGLMQDQSCMRGRPHRLVDKRFLDHLHRPGAITPLLGNSIRRLDDSSLARCAGLGVLLAGWIQ